MMYKFLSKKKFLKKISFIILLSILSLINASCPDVTPWSTPVALSNSGNITSNIFSAGTNAGFMAVWVDSSNTAHSSFSTDGLSWQTNLISPTQGNIADAGIKSDVFVAGNSKGFIVTWVDNSNNGWSSFSSDNGQTWGSAIQINPNSLSLNSNCEIFVAGSSSGFVATMIGADNNAYVSFSTGTTAWSAPTQVTNDGSVYDRNGVGGQSHSVTRGFVNAVIAGNSCMLTWITNSYPTYSAYFTSINPFSSVRLNPILNVGFFESVPVTTIFQGYFMSVCRANAGSSGETYFSTATQVSNWAVFSPFTTNPTNPDNGPWVIANQAGFLAAWTVNGNPVWTLSTNNGFNWTPVCSILNTSSTTIFAPIGLSANTKGFIATWRDENDSNAYATFYPTPSSATFVPLLQSKYGPLL